MASNSFLIFISMLIPYSFSRICSFSSGVNEKDSSVFRRRYRLPRSPGSFSSFMQIQILYTFFRFEYSDPVNSLFF